MEASRNSTAPKYLVISSSLPECLAQTCVGTGPWEKPSVPTQRHLPAEARERHCPVIGLYSWFSSTHTHRKDPSTFSQKASPHTPLSSSHSFTSGKGSTDQVRRVPHSWQLFVLPAVPRLVVSAGNKVTPWEQSNPSAIWGKGLPEAGLKALVCVKGPWKHKAKFPNSDPGFKEQLGIVLQASYVHFV